MAEFFIALEEGELDYRYIDVRHQMESCGSIFIVAIADHVKEQNGTVSNDNLILFASVYSAGRFFQESEWEGRRPPIDADGVLSLNPNVVSNYLKSVSWRRAQRFLGGHRIASEFFFPYSKAGDGNDMLKEKSSIEETLLEKKFNELIAFVEQHEQKVAE